MPTYEYECKSCGYRFDAFQSMSEDPLKTCPKCGKGIHRLINGGSGIIFKGGGFYITDNGGKHVSTGKSPEAPKTETAKTGESTHCTDCAKSDTCPKAANS